MKHFILIFLFLFIIQPVFSEVDTPKKEKVFFPKKAGVVTDYFRFIKDDTEKEIEKEAKELNKITSFNLAVAVIHTALPLDPETYGQELYDKWDVGNKEQGFDHGILLLIDIIDHKVIIVPGEEVKFILRPRIIEDLQWGLFPILNKGDISKATYVGAKAITRYVSIEWTKHMQRRWITLRTFLLVLGGLTASSIVLSLIFKGTFMTVFGTIVGGLIGFLLLKWVGLGLGATIGFLMNLWGPAQKEGAAEKELRVLYEQWRAEMRQKGKIGKIVEKKEKKKHED